MAEARRFAGRFWERLTNKSAGRAPQLERVAGRPPSANGASSFHLIWEVPEKVTWAEVGVTLRVTDAPVVPRLYFWALQVSFPSGAAAHLGLQWGADAPRRVRHVNWGGYGSDDRVLSGSKSALPSSFDNPNTRDYEWETGRPYRLRISQDGEGWAGWVGDILVRHLHVPDSAVVDPIVWSEVFADCDHPAVTVRWSDPAVVDSSGQHVQICAAVTHYQARREGGCDNTSSTVEGDTFVQRTSTPRRSSAGTRLVLGPR